MRHDSLSRPILFDPKTGEFEAVRQDYDRFGHLSKWEWGTVSETYDYDKSGRLSTVRRSNVTLFRSVYHFYAFAPNEACSHDPCRYKIINVIIFSFKSSLFMLFVNWLQVRLPRGGQDHLAADFGHHRRRRQVRAQVRREERRARSVPDAEGAPPHVQDEAGGGIHAAPIQVCECVCVCSIYKIPKILNRMKSSKFMIVK